MNKKWFALFAACTVGLAACGQDTEPPTGGNEGNEGDVGSEETVYTNPYNYVYSYDPESFDYVYSYQQIDNRHTTNFVDGLLEHNQYGTIVGALATDYSVNDDATEFTFNIREGVKWVTDEGIEYAEVTAHDFVTGLRHAAEFNSQTLYLVQYTIKNLDAYVNGEVTWEEVGVKALDDYTLQYTLNNSTPYFHTLTTYSTLMPVNQEFLESKGTGCALGSPEPSTCSFGQVAPDGILYNGAYTLSNFTAKSVIEYEANPSYWDAENVHIPTVKLVYYDGSDPDSLFTSFDKGEFSIAPVYTDNAAIYEQAKERYGDDIYVGSTNSTTYFVSLMMDRNQFHAVGDESTDVSPQTEQQREDTAKAKLNLKFRQALSHAWDTRAGNAQYVGDDLAENRLRNMLTQYEFVLTSDGTMYGELVEKALAVQNPDVYGEGIDLEDGHMAYHNVELARSLMAEAKVELEADGVTFPIQLDVQANSESEKEVKQVQAVVESLETTFAGDVEVNIIMSNSDRINAQHSADQYNTDFQLGQGWGPDYGDPKTYVNIFDPDQGDMLTYVGLNWETDANHSESDKNAKEALGLYEFQKLIQEADAIVDDNDARFAKYAEAEAWLLDHAIITPYISVGGGYAVSKEIPYTGLYGAYGLSSDKFKGRQVSDNIISLEERDALKADWKSKLGQ